MISLIMLMQYPKRKRVILHLMMLVMIFAIGMVFINNSTESISRSELSRLSLKMIALFMPFLVLFIQMDHHAPYFKSFDAYFGRSRMFFAKGFTSLIIFTYAWIVVMLVEQSLLTFLTHQMPDVTELHMRGLLHLDGMLLITIIPMIFKDKHKTLSILIPVAWIVLSMMLEDIDSRWITYLVPITIEAETMSNLAYTYKLCYSVLVMIFSHQKSVWETI